MPQQIKTPMPEGFSIQETDLRDEWLMKHESGAGIHFMPFYERWAGYGYEKEEDVFDVSLVDVPARVQGRGLGTLMLKESIDYARSQGFPLMRLGVVNTSMISIIERLKDDRVIGQVAYVPSLTHERYIELPSREVLESEDKVTAEEAIDFLNMVSKQVSEAVKRGEDEQVYMRSVTTVINLQN